MVSRNSAPDSPSVPVELSPERRLAAAVERYGQRDVVTLALSLLAGNHESEEFLLYVGGAHAQGLLDGAPVLYWPELWGARALLHVWDESAIDDAAKTLMISALNNTAWRLREMGARLAATRGLPATSELVDLLTDDVPRVRAAAATALSTLGSADHIDAVRALLKDPEIDVRRAAQRSLDALRKRVAKNER